VNLNRYLKAHAQQPFALYKKKLLRDEKNQEKACTAVSGLEMKIKVFKENQSFLRKRREIRTSHELSPPTQS
jgi:hypothetical protein